MDEVLDGLFVSSAFELYSWDESDVDEYGLSEVVTLSRVEEGGGPSVSTTNERFGIRDGGKQEYSRFRDAVLFVGERVVSGERVVVHCTMGVNRSVGVAAGVVALVEGVSASTALERVKDVRSVASPFPGTVEALERFVDEEVVVGGGGVDSWDEFVSG